MYPAARLVTKEVFACRNLPEPLAALEESDECRPGDVMPGIDSDNIVGERMIAPSHPCGSRDARADENGGSEHDHQ